MPLDTQEAVTFDKAALRANRKQQTLTERNVNRHRPSNLESLVENVETRSLAAVGLLRQTPATTTTTTTTTSKTKIASSNRYQDKSSFFQEVIENNNSLSNKADCDNDNTNSARWPGFNGNHSSRKPARKLSAPVLVEQLTKPTIQNQDEPQRRASVAGQFNEQLNRKLRRAISSVDWNQVSHYLDGFS